MGSSFKKKIGDNLKAIFFASTIAYFAISLMLVYAPNFAYAVTVEDSPLTSSLTVNAFVDTSINATTLVWLTGLDPGSTDNLATSSPIVLVNTANSNTNIDVYLFGTNITNNAATLAFGGTNITVYNESGSASISNPINLSAMGFLNNTAANNGWRENLPPSAATKTNSNYSLYFWIDIPAGQTASTEYHSVVTIRSIADGQSPA